jgi:mitochondrial fission protein ELM1
LAIASGKRSVDAAMALRRAARGNCFTVQIQDPRVDPKCFDLVITPQHDRLEGENVFSTLGGINQITKENLTQAAEAFADRYGDLPRPLLALVLGGNSKAYRMTEACMAALGKQLAALLRAKSAGLLITASRRTPPGCLEALLKELAGLPYDHWDGTGENPYLAYLALAEQILVTCDSVNMVSEAASTGKPVQVIELDGGSAKLTRFHDALLKRGAIRFFDGKLETWHYEPLADTAEAAAEVRRRFAAGTN